MSVAPELPPIVHIPAGARRRAASLTLVGAGPSGPVYAGANALLVDLPETGLSEIGLSEIGLPEIGLSGSGLSEVLAPSGPARLWLVPELGERARAEYQRPATVGSRRSLRLTARGRVALCVLTLMATGLLLLLAHASAPGPAGHPGVVAPAVVTVHDGDTLWSVAGQVAPGQDPRAVVDQLEKINHLSSPDVFPGQVLYTR